jgi:conjugal transfer/entry exclusion protein
MSTNLLTPLQPSTRNCAGLDRHSAIEVQDCQHKLQLALVDKEYLKKEVSNLETRLREQQAQVAALDDSLAAEKDHSWELYRRLLSVRFTLARVL